MQQHQQQQHQPRMSWQCGAADVACTQVVLPLAPGVESVWQPVQEELDEAMATVRDVLDENLDNLQVGSGLEDAGGCMGLAASHPFSDTCGRLATFECAGGGRLEGIMLLLWWRDCLAPQAIKQSHSPGILGHHQALHVPGICCDAGSSLQAPCLLCVWSQNPRFLLQDAADDVKDRYQEAVHVLLEEQKAGVPKDRDLLHKLQAAAHILSKPRDTAKAGRHHRRHAEDEIEGDKSSDVRSKGDDQDSPGRT